MVLAAVVVGALACLLLVAPLVGKGTGRVFAQAAGEGSPPAAPGTVLLADNFDDAAAGVLPAAPRGSPHEFGYEGGEYFLRRVNPDTTRLATLELPGSYGNLSVAVDVRLVGETARRVAALQCRRAGGVDEQQYRFEIDPDQGRFRLLRFVGNTEGVLIDWTASPTLRRGEATNRIELSCVGPVLTATINGTVAASTQDASLQEGRVALSVGVLDRRVTVAEARFDNLMVTQR